MINTITYTAIDEFEQLYIRLRDKEGRLYTDEEVALLPSINKWHRYSNEWEIRKQSLKRLTTYLKRKGKEWNALEIGCGNGWLSAQLANCTQGKVTGIDVNKVEIEQAKKVFQQRSNLEFFYGSLDDFLVDNKFDVIVFAASIQYFPFFKNIIAKAFTYLTLQGEIHIIDSCFYPQKEIAAAKERTALYFKTLDCDEMAAFYFHHSINDCKIFNAKILYDPAAWNNKWSNAKNPFYHIVIKNRYQ